MNRLPFLTLILFSISAAAQPRVVDFSELQQFLPNGNFENFVRGKADGETSTMMGFTTSWAQVAYSSISDSDKSTVSVKITDMLNIPSYMSIPPSSSGTPEPSIDSGYKRTVNYNDLSVLETYDSTSRQGKLQLTLATRFLIEISGHAIRGTSTLFQFLDGTDVNALKEIAVAGTVNQKK